MGEKDKRRQAPRLGAALALLLAAMPACMHVTYTTGKPTGRQEHRGTSHFFLWGLANTADIYVDEVCPQGAARVTVYKGFADGLLEVVTAGVYTPRSWAIRCAATADKPAAKVHP